jgi:hypothetical protein
MMSEAETGALAAAPRCPPGTAIPASLRVVGNTQGFFAGRVYAPSAVQYDENNVTVVFAGYNTQKPKNGLGDYRTIGRVSLRSSMPLLAVGAGGPGAKARPSLTAGSVPRLGAAGLGSGPLHGLFCKEAVLGDWLQSFPLAGAPEKSEPKRAFTLWPSTVCLC